MRALKAVVKFFGSGLRAGFALIGILAMGSALANYNMTIPGSGTQFASTVISTVHYANMMLCDFVAGNTQCAAVDSSGNVAVKVSLSSGSDGSASITTGATAQNLFSGVTPSHGWEVCNPDPSEDVWLSQSTTAAANGQGSIRVAANGGCASNPSTMAPFHAISVIAPTTGHKLTATQW